MQNSRHPSLEPAVSRRGWTVSLWAVLLVLGLYYAIQLLTLVLAVYPHLGLPSDMTQPGSWVQSFDHHFWQMVLALGAIGWFAGSHWRDWGLNLRNLDASLQLAGRFCYYYGLYFIGIGFIVQLLFFGAPVVDHPMNATHVIGRLAFGFLFVGVSEEILFRGLIHTYLGRYWSGVWSFRTWEMPVAGVLATLIFTLAHVNFSVAPFEVTHLYVPQLLMAFVLGLFYSAAYHRTGSLLAPILAHNFSDGTLWASEYVLIGLS